MRTKPKWWTIKMMNGVFVIFGIVIGCAIVVSEAAHLPSYIKACSRSDPNINECAKKQAIITIPHILKGDKNFNQPSFLPLHLPEVKIQPSDNLQLKLTNCVISGFENMLMDDIQLDFEQRHVKVDVSSSYLNLVSEYEIDGRILILPITGHGPANLTFINGKFHYAFDYDLIKKHGKEYINLKNPTLKYETERNYYHFDNLFNGDERLGNEMNRFLNENWRDVSHDLGPAVSETISVIVTSILKGYFTRIPYNEIFLP